MGRIDDLLKQRRDNNLFRTVRPAGMRGGGLIEFAGKTYLDFSSNDYLGLSNHPRLKEAAKEATDKFGTGSSASRLLSGSLKLHEELESRTAEFKEKAAALVFNSGYQANVGVISAIAGKEDAIFYDRLCHASIIDGILLSGARHFRFNHNDIGHLDSLLRSWRLKFKEAIIVTESIFSMDGDRAPVRELIRLRDKYNCRVMVDEAHATGIFGQKGSGIVAEEGLSGEVDIVMGTFSKALGSFGAYVASSREVKDYLINMCRSFIYSTALPPAVIAANIAALDVVRDEPHRRKELLQNSGLFRDGLKKRGFNIRGESQIIPLITGDSAKAVKMSETLREKGYWALPIRQPTVPAGQARLRFSLTYDHGKDKLREIVNEI